MCYCDLFFFSVCLLALLMSVLDPPPIYQLDKSPSPPGVVSVLTLLPQQPLEPFFELLLMLIQPSKHICITNKKTKNLKPKSESKGPFNISVNTEWDAFLGIIAKKISFEPSHLLVSSFEWHWLKPTSGPWLVLPWFWLLMVIN